MAIKHCPNPSYECPWFRRPTPAALEGTQEHGCFSDNDHIVPRFLGETAIENAQILKEYIRLPENQQQICRWEHDIKTREEELNPPEPPSREFMEDAIIRAIESGIVSLSVNRRKKIFGKGNKNGTKHTQNQWSKNGFSSLER